MTLHMYLGEASNGLVSLVGCFGISTLVGYLMPNPVNIH